MEDNIELIVTSIKELTKKRRLVYINYEPAFALYAAELRKFGIKDGESVRKEAHCLRIRIIQEKVWRTSLEMDIILIRV